MINHIGNRNESDRFGAVYLASCSAFNAHALVERLTELCANLADLFRKVSIDPSALSRVWICVDRRDPDVQPLKSSALIDVRVRFDFLRAAALPEYHAIGLAITILRPGDFDLLKQGWPSFRQWLLEEVLKGWRTSLLALTDERLAAVLASTRAWIHGQPERVFGYDDSGKPSAIDDRLSGSEDSYALFSEENVWDDEDEDDGDKS